MNFKRELNRFLLFLLITAICGVQAVLLSMLQFRALASHDFIQVTLACSVFLLLMIFSYCALKNWQQQKVLSQTLIALDHNQKIFSSQLKSGTAELQSFGNFKTDDIMAELKILESLLGRLADEVNTARVNSNSQDQKEKVIDDDQVILQPASYSITDTIELIHQAIKSDRIEMMLQPTVSLPQRKLRFFECFSQLKDQNDDIINFENVASSPRGESVMQIIDNTLLFRCLQLIRKLVKKKLDVRFFYNLSIATLCDQKFINSFMDFIASNRLITENIIFEMDYNHLMHARAQNNKIMLSSILDSFTQLGCHFSVDHVKNLDVNFQYLQEHGVKFLKIDAVILMATIKEDAGNRIKMFKQQADQHGVDIVLTKIEQQEQLLELLDFHFDYGQGFFFSPPRLSSKW